MKPNSVLTYAGFPLEHLLDENLEELIEVKNNQNLERKSKKLRITDPKEELKSTIKTALKEYFSHCAQTDQMLYLLEVVRSIFDENNLTENLINEILINYSFDSIEIKSNLVHVLETYMNETKQKQIHSELFTKAKRKSYIDSIKSSIKIAKNNLETHMKYSIELQKASFEECREYHYQFRGETLEYQKVSDYIKGSIKLKIFYCMMIVKSLYTRDVRKLKYLSSILQKIDQYKLTNSLYDIDQTIKQYFEWNSKFKNKYSLEVIVSNITQDELNLNKVCPRTLLNWYNEYKRSGFESWFLFKRGKHIRKNRLEDIIINDQSIETYLLIFLQQNQDYSIKDCCDCVRELLDDNFPDEVLNKKL
jgi:hypothetical protein